MATKTVGAVERICLLLECLQDGDAQIGVRELSRRTEMSVPTVHRLCASMLKAGLLTQRADTRRYLLGPRLLQLGAAALGQLEVRRVALSHMQKLRDYCRETVTLSILRGREQMTVEQVIGPRVLAIRVQAGALRPLARGAPGKAFLAFFEEGQAREIAGERWVELEGELRAIRKRRYATSQEEVSRGVAAVSAPVFDHLGDVAAVLSIVAPLGQIPTDAPTEFVDALLAAARAISREMGFSHPGK